jgi:hypothetical protein
VQVIELVVAGSAVAAAALASVALLFLPGLALARRLVQGPAAVGVTAVGISLVAMAITTGTLVAAGIFHPGLVALTAIAMSALSIRSAVAWWRELTTRDRVGLALCVIATAPWALITLDPGLRPADTLQWYYWDLGLALSAAGGIPATVREYGWDVRWLPDYLYFNGLSEAFGAMLAPFGTASAAQVWKVPLAFGGIGSTYLVARLWLRPSAAITATTLVVASVYFTAKFDAYKPESLAIVVGLLATWLVVTGIRRREIALIVVGGLILGVDMAIHPIAATVMGFLLFGACLSELAFADEGRRSIFVRCAAAAFIALAVMVGTGATLQGRPLVIVDALRPTHIEGDDPTWRYLQYSTGRFDEAPPPGRFGRLASGITSPWPGVRVTGLSALWFAWLAGSGLLLAMVLGDRRVRLGLLAGAIGSSVLVAGALFFAYAFSTYVPRHTGLVRLGQYAPLVFGLAMGFVFEGLLLAWQRLSQAMEPRRMALLLALGCIVWLGPLNAIGLQSQIGLPPQGRAALAQLDVLADGGDVVLSNAVTGGTIEFMTSLEAPLEGRQPLLEEPALLSHANEVLLATHRLFDEGDHGVLETLSVNWLLLVDDPATLGAQAVFGGSSTSLAGRQQIQERWRADGVAIFEVTGSERQPVSQARRAEISLAAWLIAVLATALTIGAALFLGRRAVLAHGSPATTAQPGGY